MIQRSFREITPLLSLTGKPPCIRLCAIIRHRRYIGRISCASTRPFEFSPRAEKTARLHTGRAHPAISESSRDIVPFQLRLVPLSRAWIVWPLVCSYLLLNAMIDGFGARADSRQQTAVRPVTCNYCLTIGVVCRRDGMRARVAFTPNFAPLTLS